MATTTSQISLAELVRLAFPPGTPRPTSAFRDRIVKWVVMAGTGVTLEVGDFVLCSAMPLKNQS